ncbi:MAG: malate/L-lactate dehydrogenase [Peptococcaceae bacterium]|nr:malate/L-lactate dehydrogenase [Peptococcaceae bacterium]
MEDKQILFKEHKLKDFTTSILTKMGMTLANSEIIADSLLYADLRGVKSHGLVRLPAYVERVEKGVMNKNPLMELEQNHEAVALLNANNGFGQVAGHNAMTLAINKAKKYGIGLVGVKNSNHFGIAAFYSMLALNENMIGFVLTNASPAIAPYGTKTPLLGTNPLSIAIPAKSEKPIVLDMSTSVVARGKIRYSALINESIPLGWAMDSNGKPTDNPKEALKGSLEPIGGPKGSGLSLIIDILCGVLTNTCLTGEVKNLTDLSGPSKTGHIFCAINISNFMNVEVFKTNIDLVIQSIKNLPSADGNPVYLPGEIEHNLSQKRREEGIPMEREVITSLNSVASRYGISILS